MIAFLLLLALGGLMHAARSFSSASTAGTELAFGYLLLTAYFAGKLASKVGLPKLTGYLASGIVVGPYVLGLVTKDMGASLKLVNGVAICIIGLTAGAELNFKKVAPIIKTLRAISIFTSLGGIAFITLIIYFGLAPYFPFLANVDAIQGLALCAVFATATIAVSPAVVMAVLQETRADGPLSQLILSIVVVGDLVVIVLYAIVLSIAVALTGDGIDIGQTVMSVAWELLGSIAFGAMIGAMIGGFLRTVRNGASLFAVMICLVVAEVGTAIHLDPLIVMLAAGVWLENVSKADSHLLIGEFESAQLPVFLVFFALAGAKLDIYALWRAIVVVLVLVFSRATVFFVGARAACKMTNAGSAAIKFAWVGMLPQAGLALALAMLLQKTFPAMGAAASVIVFGVVGVNELIAPVILRAVMLRSGEAGKREVTDFVPH